MPLADALLPEFDHEMANTRKMLGRVPEALFPWQPHPKSRTAGELATHIARLPEWATRALTADSFDLETLDAKSRGTPAAGPAELLALFDRNVARARAAIEDASDGSLLSPWALRSGESTVLAMPRIAVLRSFVLSHVIHHRAQLGLYLRLNDLPVPGMYGASADETGD